MYSSYMEKMVHKKGYLNNITTKSRVPTRCQMMLIKGVGTQ